MNAGLADGTTTGDLVLQQAEIVPQTQHFFDFSHGQSLLGHSVSPQARGEIPIGCPAPLSAPTQKARSRNVNINSGSNPPLSSRFGLFTSPESLFTCPESLFTSSRNLYSHRPGIGIHMPRNTQSGGATRAWRENNSQEELRTTRTIAPTTQSRDRSSPSPHSG